MNNHNQSQQLDTTLPLKSALFGAIVGAAAVMFSRKETRDEIRDGMKKLFDTGEKKLDDAIEQAEKTKTNIAKKADKTIKALQT